MKAIIPTPVVAVPGHAHGGDGDTKILLAIYIVVNAILIAWLIVDVIINALKPKFKKSRYTSSTFRCRKPWEDVFLGFDMPADDCAELRFWGLALINAVALFGFLVDIVYNWL